MSMGSTQVAIATRDGSCRSFVYRPAGKGPWPAVLMFMDGIGIRPALLEVGARLASYGYYVLLPDLFYRSGRYEPMNAKTVFSDPGDAGALNAEAANIWPGLAPGSGHWTRPESRVRFRICNATSWSGAPR